MFFSTILELRTFRSFITNLGSELPDPKGANRLILSKKFKFKAEGLIF